MKSENIALCNDERERTEIRTLLATTSSQPVHSSASPPLCALPPPPPFNNMFNSSQGSQFPDFMFCGACTPPQDSQVALNEHNKHIAYKDNDDPTLGTVILKSTFHLRYPVTDSSEILAIHSLIQQIPSVNKVVFHSNDPNVVVYHDRSFSADSVLKALESAGYSASFQPFHMNPPAENFSDEHQRSGISCSSIRDPMLVRSQFYVRGICCASEVPAIKKIVKPLAGVSKLQINITTKMLHVQHDASVISAHQIAHRLSEEGFPSKVEKEGKALAELKQHTTNRGRSTLRVRGTITDDDAAKVERIFSRIPGVFRIGINTSESLIHVDHDIHTLTSDQCVQALEPEFVCEVHTLTEVAPDTSSTVFLLEHIEKSKYVESTIKVDGLDVQQVRNVEKNIARNFIRAQVRAIYANPISETIKVEHDPTRVSIFDVCNVLAKDGLTTVQVTVDGADAGLYLPEQNIAAGTEAPYSDEPSLLKIHVNVWLSGIFWALSMFSYREGE